MRYFFVYSFLFAVPFALSAARIDVVVPTTLTHDALGVAELFLNTEGETINIVSGRITFPDALSIRGVRTGKSIISLWIETPEVADNTISFVGAIPNGLSHAQAPLLEILFAADMLEATSSPLSGDVSVFLNQAETAVIPAVLPDVLSWNFSTTTDYTLAVDTIPPEPFSVEIVSDSNVFDGRFVAVFSAVDKQSGIDYFEMQEYRRRTPDGTAWQRVESPALLTDQARTSHIAVKAVDRTGNIRIVVVKPMARSFVGVSIFVIACLALLLYALIRRKKTI